MKAILIVTVAILCVSSALAATVSSYTCGSYNIWPTVRCSQCKRYQTSAGTTYYANHCVNPGKEWTVWTLAAEADPTANTNDQVCRSYCDTSSIDSSDIVCDDSGLLCAACASGYTTSGGAQTHTNLQPCDCKVASGNTPAQCNSCGHGYYGVNVNGEPVAPNPIEGTSDNNYYLSFSATLPSKCVACPKLTNCAQCSSATTCHKCTDESGAIPDKNYSCSASKIVASVAFVFAGLVALLF